MTGEITLRGEVTGDRRSQGEAAGGRARRHPHRADSGGERQGSRRDPREHQEPARDRSGEVDRPGSGSWPSSVCPSRCLTRRSRPKRRRRPSLPWVQPSRRRPSTDGRTEKNGRNACASRTRCSILSFSTQRRQPNRRNKAERNAGIAQLVERNLAKVEVASSSLVSRSRYLDVGGAVAKRLCSGLQIRPGRFDSAPRLQSRCGNSSVGRAQPCQG